MEPQVLVLCLSGGGEAVLHNDVHSAAYTGPTKEYTRIQTSMSQISYKADALGNLALSPRAGNGRTILAKKCRRSAGRASCRCTEMVSAERFLWCASATDGDAPRPRYGHSAWMLGDKMCVFGGVAQETEAEWRLFRAKGEPTRKPR